MDKFSHYCRVCGNEVLEDENECWVCADETDNKENYMINENEIDPTRLTVSDDGRYVYLKVGPVTRAFLNINREQSQDRLLAGEAAEQIENLPYHIYCENALAAHGSDFSYLRPDSREPFPGRVMRVLNDRSDLNGCTVPVLMIAHHPYVVIWSDIHDRSLLISKQYLRPLPPPEPVKERRPITGDEFWAVAAKNNYGVTRANGEHYRVLSIDCNEQVLLKHKTAGIKWIALSELAAENWRCGDQLLSVEE